LNRLLLVMGLVCLVTGAAYAQDIIIDAETFHAYHDEGGTMIYLVSCGAAHGGIAVEGFDYPGDWIEVTLTIENGSFTDNLRSAGLTDSVSALRATVFGAGPGGSDLISDFSTYGLGIG